MSSSSGRLTGDSPGQFTTPFHNALASSEPPRDPVPVSAESSSPSSQTGANNPESESETVQEFPEVLGEPLGVFQESEVAVRRALAETGIDPDDLRFSYRTVFTTWPEGCFPNHYLVVGLPDGREMQYSAELSIRSPDVTACHVSVRTRGYG